MERRRRERHQADKICDMHCHILPGIDDGAASMEETLAVIEDAVRQGIRRMIVTPHFHPGRYMANAGLVMERLRQVKEECIKNRIPITLYPGQECYYFSGLVDELKKGNALTMAGSRYVLVEFEPDCLYSYLQRGLRELQNGGYHPILAHFERYAALKKREQIYDLREQGIMMQMNFDSLRRKDTLLYKNPWRKLVKEGMVDFLGSDCHGMGFRPLHVKEADTWMKEQADKKIRYQMYYENIEKIIRNE